MYDQVKKSWAKQSVALDVRTPSLIWIPASYQDLAVKKKKKVLKNKCFLSAYICIDISMLTVMLLQGVEISWLCSCFKLRFPFCPAWLLIALASMPSLRWYFPRASYLFFYSISYNGIFIFLFQSTYALCRNVYPEVSENDDRCTANIKTMIIPSQGSLRLAPFFFFSFIFPQECTCEEKKSAELSLQITF